eukprot:7809697-Alexandrium_andersonii.AAC.1
MTDISQKLEVVHSGFWVMVNGDFDGAKFETLVNDATKLLEPLKPLKTRAGANLDSIKRSRKRPRSELSLIHI